MSYNFSISVSKGNTKMGAIPSISLPPIVTCSNRAIGTCSKKCYACKICRYSKEAKAAYSRNLDILKNNPDLFFKILFIVNVARNIKTEKSISFQG